MNGETQVLLPRVFIDERGNLIQSPHPEALVAKHSDSKLLRIASENESSTFRPKPESVDETHRGDERSNFKVSQFSRLKHVASSPNVECEGVMAKQNKLDKSLSQSMQNRVDLEGGREGESLLEVPESPSKLQKNVFSFRKPTFSS